MPEYQVSICNPPRERDPENLDIAPVLREKLLCERIVELISRGVFTPYLIIKALYDPSDEFITKEFIMDCYTKVTEILFERWKTHDLRTEAIGFLESNNMILGKLNEVLENAKSSKEVIASSRAIGDTFKARIEFLRFIGLFPDGLMREKKSIEQHTIKNELEQSLVIDADAIEIEIKKAVEEDANG
ncbi:MAG: hypothetical protein WC998_00595 [Candidatus Paceibacterota bacterium]